MTIHDHDHDTPAMLEDAHGGDEQCLRRGLCQRGWAKRLNIDRLRGDTPRRRIRQR